MNSYKNILNKAENPRYIPGIYNYCDRWCERCAFTSRCLTYAMEKEDAENTAAWDINNKAFWDKLHLIFQQTIELINKLAEERGIDLKSMDKESASGVISQRMDEAKHHELSLTARYYSDIVDRWFEAEHSLFEEKQNELNTMLNLGIKGDRPFAEANEIRDAVGVIRWYQRQIYAKLIRALTQDEPSNIESESQRDSDGSALVALIAIDRSTGAWGNLQEYFPEKTDDILDILLHLDRLRRKVEQRFPNARKFKRPGFDDLSYDT